MVDFNYPFFLSFVHMVINSVGSFLIFRNIAADKHRLKADDGAELGIVQRMLGVINRRELDRQGRLTMLAFSIVFSLNIAVGNVSLKYVSVNFNQVMRSLVPAITIIMGLGLGKRISPKRQLSVIPVVFGVAMACFGDMSYSALGFFYTVSCILLASLKVVASGEILTGNLKLHPVDLMSRMAPLALVQCLILSLLSGEVTDIVGRWDGELNPRVNPLPATVVLMSALCSFTFNISSLMANKITSPLTLCITANVKQVIMLALSTVLFRVEITPLNGAGIIVVLVGSANYSIVSVAEKMNAEKTREANGGDVEVPKEHREGR